jgi:hypothetical protein
MIPVFKHTFSETFKIWVLKRLFCLDPNLDPDCARNLVIKTVHKHVHITLL